MTYLLETVEFERDEAGVVPFTSYNMRRLGEFVLPIIAENEGWGTGRLTKEAFLAVPRLFRGVIDATVSNYPDATVIIAFDEQDRPVGLLEYTTGGPFAEGAPAREVLDTMLGSPNSDIWNYFLAKGIVLPQDLTDSTLAEARALFERRDNQVTSQVGVVVTPELQGQRSGVSDQLYQHFDNAIVYGWTSSPLVIAKRRHLFDKTLFYPQMEDTTKTEADELLAMAIVLADMLTLTDEQSDWKTHRFGARTADFFVDRDMPSSVAMARELAGGQKLAATDVRTLEYLLERKKAHGAVISYAKPLEPVA